MTSDKPSQKGGLIGLYNEKSELESDWASDSALSRDSRSLWNVASKGLVHFYTPKAKSSAKHVSTQYTFANLVNSRLITVIRTLFPSFNSACLLGFLLSVRDSMAR